MINFNILFTYYAQDGIIYYHSIGIDVGYLYLSTEVLILDTLIESMDNNTVEASRFSKWRAIIFPIFKSEIALFATISLLLFSILFNQNILRILKNGIIISEISVEVISFIKMYCVTPFAGLFVIIYANLVNRFTLYQVFYIFLSIFVVFYATFGYVIYPNFDALHISSDNCNYLVESYPHGKWFIVMMANWSYVLFYVFSELWPNIFYMLMFWQICNHISTIDQATRFYRICALFGNSAVIFAGLFMQSLSSNEFIYNFLNLNNSKQNLIQISLLTILISSSISFWCVHRISKKFKNYKFEIKIKPKLGIKESFRYLINSKYLWMMLICSAAFGLSMNLVEAVWYSQIKELYPSLSDNTEYHSFYVIWTGCAIMFFTIFGGVLMRFFGWFVTTLLTPVIILVTGSVFFIFTIFNQEIFGISGSIIGFTVFIGGIQNILSKGIKYSLWDSFREMLYIPLDVELKTKGKAAVDLLSSKLGKSLSSGIQSILFILMPNATYTSISPLMMTFFIFTCFAWILALFSIRKEYDKLTQLEI